MNSPVAPKPPRFFALALAAAFLCLAAAACGEKDQARPAAVPEVIKVTPHSVTVGWESEKPGRGTVYFTPATGGEQQKATEKAEARFHEVEAAGLSPGARYSYRLSPKGPAFQFQTQPKAVDPFSFVIVEKPDAERVQALFLDEVPEFFVALEAGPPSANDAFSQVRPFVPVFTPRGQSSPFLDTLSKKKEKGGPFYLDWGGLRLAFLKGDGAPADLFDNATAHTFGLVQKPAGDFPWDSPGRLRESPLHRALLAHNEKNPDRKAAFVLVDDGSGKSMAQDDIYYAGIPYGGGPLRVDVDVTGVRALDLASDLSYVLKRPPIKKKLTCADCRRLADQGTYEEAVAAYQAFIENNRGSYQVDDAIYAIAELLDEKLFRPAQALSWYDRLAADYPDASLTPLARQRAAFLRKYSDYDFKPLVLFERIRKVDFLRAKDDPQKRDALLGKVEALVQAYPASAIAPAVSLWLGNQYRAIDPERAVATYKKLIADYPQSPEAREAWIQIGDTWYAAEHFGKAIEAYREAARNYPDLQPVMDVQVARCERNIFRSTLNRASWAAVLLLFLAAVLWPPIGMPLRPALSWLIASALLFLAVLLGAWLIREQFSSNAEMWLLACAFGFAPAFAGFIASTLAHKAWGRSSAGLFTSLLLSTLLFAALLYLCIYYIYVHYLIIIGL